AAMSIGASGADFVFYAPSTTEQASKFAAALNPKVRVFATDTVMSDKFVVEAGNNAVNWFIIRNGADSLAGSSTQSDFVNTFNSHYRRTPSQFAANAYQLVGRVLDAVGNNLNTPKSEMRSQVLISVLSNAAQQTPPRHNSITFDSNGDPNQWIMTGYKLANGKF